MDTVTYQPDPIDTDAADLSGTLTPLVERWNENVQDP